MRSPIARMDSRRVNRESKELLAELQKPRKEKPQKPIKKIIKEQLDQ